MFQFLIHVEFSRSMVAILEVPQYVAYQKNVAHALFTLSTKSHTFILHNNATFMGLAALLLKGSIAQNRRLEDQNTVCTISGSQ